MSMRISFLLLLAACLSCDIICAQAPAPTPGSYPTVGAYNYIRIWQAKAPENDPNNLTLRPVSDVTQTTQYFDGLGRPIQTVGKQATPLLQDMVVPIVYDSFGRVKYTYLPFPATSLTGGPVTNDGNFKTDAFAEQKQFYQTQFPGELFYYDRTVYERSPLDRTTAAYSPGNSWVGAGRNIATAYDLNGIPDSVKMWYIDSLAGSVPTSPFYYSPGMLFRNTTTDEQGHRVVEYKDKNELVVLKKVQLWDSPAPAGSGWLCTYYVYDDLNNLRFVIPPKAVEWLAQNSWSFSGSSGSQVASGLCYRYEYDNRDRIIVKQIPDAGETWIVYDTRDRIVMEQDQNHRGNSWVVHKYDNLNREDSLGLLVDANTRNYHQNLANSSSAYPVIGGTGYTLYTRTFYDDYNWVAGTSSGLNSTYATRYSGNSDYFITSSNTGPLYAQPLTPSTMTKGLITGQAIDALGSYMTYKVNFYDNRSRPLQSISTTWPLGRDTTSFQYDFSGKVLRKLVTQNDPSNIAVAHLASTKTAYDAAGRPTSTKMRMEGAATDQVIDSMTYNELGQMSVDRLGNSLDKLVFEYNIRGWLKSTNKDYIAGTMQSYFAEELGYDNSSTSAPGTSFGGLQYNGNIAGQVWKSAGDGVIRKYGFMYDNVNRLLDADFRQYSPAGEWGNLAMDFSVHHLAYDANGNILSMSQHGYQLGHSSDAIDSLTYQYVSAFTNRLNLVTDAKNDQSSVLGDFHYNTGTKTGQDYRYDGMGNLTVDNNKGIKGISHNFLNLSEFIQFPGKGSIQYTYTADGNKVRKIVWDSVTRHINTTYYSNGFVYNNTDSFVHRPSVVDTLQFVSHPEGRVRWALHHYNNGTAGYGYEYDFFERDHLGNTRVLLTQEKDTAHYIATMEAAYRNTEMALFYNIDSTSYPTASIPGGYPADPNATNPNDSLARVNGNGHKMGPALLLKVMSGDTIQMVVNSFYRSGGTNANNGSSLQDVLNSLAGGLASLAGPGHGTAAGLSSSGSPVYAALNSFLPDQESDTTGKPKAYLNWMLLDNQFNYVSGGGQSGAQRVRNADVINPLGGAINVNHSGYLYIWVSNETKGWDVFYDNLSVVHRSGPMLEENHYYPFGLTMAGISDKVLKGNYAENKYRYNKGSELQNKEFSDGSGLETYDTHFRTLDPQLGKWWQVDPKADAAIDPNSADEDETVEENLESVSPYTSMDNNPIKHNDPNGDCPTCILGAIIGAAVDYGTQVASNYALRKENPWTNNISLTSITTSAAAGFLTSGGSAVETAFGKAAVKLGATVVNNLVDIKTSKDGLTVKVEKNPANLVKNVLIDVAVDKGAAKIGSKTVKLLSKTAGFSPGKITKTVKSVIKSSGIKITRNVNQTVKEGAKKSVEQVQKTVENSVKAMVKAPADKAKDKTDISDNVQ